MDTITNDSIVPGRYWEPLPDGRLECRLCPRACRLHDNQRGLCFVRMRQGDQIMLTTYGRSSGFSIDPIEKKPLNHFLPGSTVLSFGTAGCNLACKFCQNWDISKSREMQTLAVHAMPEDIARTAQKNGCMSVAFTYNDPVIFLEYVVDTALACHAADIRTVAVTAGYMSACARPEFFRHIDAANVDLKAFTERFYRDICGGRLRDVQDTLEFIRQETGVWLELTTLLIPGENDSEEELNELSAWVAKALGPDTPLHFTAFHPDWKMREYPATPAATLRTACEIAKRNGLHYVYTGNIHDREGGSTFCAACGRLLIGRDWHNITEYRLTPSGCCDKCGARLPGVF